MKLRIFPLDQSSLTRLNKLAQKTREGTRVLSELIGSAKKDRDEIFNNLHQLEAESSDLHFSVLTSMQSSFVTPLNREDLYQVSNQLYDIIEDIVTAGELINLADTTKFPFPAVDQIQIISRQAELSSEMVKNLSDIDNSGDQWMEILRLTKQAQRSHNQYIPNLYEETKGSKKLRTLDVANALLEISKDFKNLATICCGIALKES
ncbi:MAG: nuclease PIN [Micrococcaceae bacterium]